MNPVIVIPTYWCGVNYHSPEELFRSYDHMTPINQEGELARCLKSLHEVRGICRIVIPVISEELPEGQATTKVQAIVSAFPELDTLIIGPGEMHAIYERMDQLGLSDYKEAVTTTGYGSMRNLGLIIAAILGHTEVVFIDDDEIVTDPEFLVKALYGLGKLTKRGIPVLAKTGFYLDRRGGWQAAAKDPWYNAAMKQNEAFNEWINTAMSGPRLVPSNSCYGGCIAIHIEAFKRVAFDPWITRGEDLDYMVNLRMFGLDMWFDNQWSLRHLPPRTTSEAVRFRQDAYRWIYEHRKLEYLRSQIDLLQIRPRDLDPYPGPFVDSSITSRLFITGLLRSIARPDTGGYVRTAFRARREGEQYAQEHCSRYFRFQTVWPRLIGALEGDSLLAEKLTGGRERRHSGMTESFDAISSDPVWETEAVDVQRIAQRWSGGGRSSRATARSQEREQQGHGRHSIHRGDGR